MIWRYSYVLVLRSTNIMTENDKLGIRVAVETKIGDTKSNIKD
jgi:hypothetical protein